TDGPDGDNGPHAGNRQNRANTSGAPVRPNTGNAPVRSITSDGPNGGERPIGPNRRERSITGVVSNIPVGPVGGNGVDGPNRGNGHVGNRPVRGCGSGTPAQPGRGRAPPGVVRAGQIHGGGDHPGAAWRAGSVARAGRSMTWAAAGEWARRRRRAAAACSTWPAGATARERRANCSATRRGCSAFTR